MMIEIRNREYSVIKVDGNPNAENQILKESKYLLTGKRGAEYFTMRNVKNPHLMFVCGRSKTLDNVWLSDENGQLKVVRS